MPHKFFHNIAEYSICIAKHDLYYHLFLSQTKTKITESSYTKMLQLLWQILLLYVHGEILTQTSDVLRTLTGQL